MRAQAPGRAPGLADGTMSNVARSSGSMFRTVIVIAVLCQAQRVKEQGHRQGKLLWQVS